MSGYPKGGGNQDIKPFAAAQNYLTIFRESALDICW